MRLLFRSLYARVAAAYLVLLAALFAGSACVLLGRIGMFGTELDQRLNRPLGGNLAMIFAPTVANQGPDSPGAFETARHILAINPSLALYLVDADGHVRVAYDAARCGEGAQVDLEAVRRLSDPASMLPVLAPDPCTGQPEAFSVAPIAGPHGQPLLLYAVLRPRGFESAAAMLRQSYLTRTLALTFGVSLLLAGAIGVIWFALLTRRFRQLQATVGRFKDGDLGARVPGGRDDEIGRLGVAFNEMATTIDHQVAALHRMDTQRRELIENLSHDLRTPLTSLRAWCEALHSDPGPGGVRCDPEILLGMQKNVDQVASLLDSLSQVARLDVPDAPIRPEPFPLAELLQDVVVKLDVRARSSGVTLVLEVGPELPSVLADIGQIERVLANLVENALAATPPGGRITVEARRNDAHVLVAVADSGIGIPHDEQAAVTQRFYRTKSSRDTHEGSGLGLAIVTRVLEQHGSHLHIRSAPGAGTRMEFSLPIAPPQAGA